MARARPGRATWAVGLLLATALALLFAVAPAQAADRGTIFKVGGDVNVPRADTADTIVAVGGDVTIAGTVRNTVVAVGGDVHLQPTAVVGSEASSGDTGLVLAGGSLQREPGAVLNGKTSRVSGSWAGDVWDNGIVDPVARPFAGFSLISWLSGTLLALLGAVIIAALMPRMTQRVRDRIRSRFWPSLGWGALSLIIIVPLVTILLVITIVGILAVLPWLFVVIATLIVGAIAVAATVGGWILPRFKYSRENLILAAVIGVVVLRLVQLIPFVGSIVVGVAWAVGFGGSVLALWDWQRRRREQARELKDVHREEGRAA